MQVYRRKLGDVGRGNGNDGRGNGRGEINAVNKQGLDQKSTSDASIKTVVVQHIVSTSTVQASVGVLLAGSPVETAPWWIAVESIAERLFRKIFLLTGSIGEKIRRKNVLRNGKRKEIYDFVVDNPFSHFRKITRMVGVGPNEDTWHLRILEKMGLIKSERIGRYLTYQCEQLRSYQ